MFVGLDDEKWRRVFLGLRYVMVDQLLVLHANLTDVQARLLDILHQQVRDIEEKGARQQDVQTRWNEFTLSLQDSLDLISGNTTTLLQDVFSGLLKLQVLTRDSKRFVV
jgi:hypothetical protein